MSEMSTEAEIVTVVLPAQVDSATATSVERLVMDALSPGVRVIVDGGGVSYMSAAGVRALATVLHKAAEVHARIVFCQFKGAAGDCLQVSGFGQLLDVAESTEEAATRLRAEPVLGSAERLHPRHTTG